MPLTPEDVQNKRFSTVRFKEGYDEEEVDAFLDEVEAELRRLLGENSELRSRPPTAAPTAAPVTPQARPAAPARPGAEEPQEAALRTLLLAQRTADEAIAQAKAEADQVKAAARDRAAALERDAQQKHAAAVSDLQRQRTQLERSIEELRVFEREYRTRLKAYLENQLRDLDSKGPMAPAGPPPGAGVNRPSGPGGPRSPHSGQPAPSGSGPSGHPGVGPPGGAPRPAGPNAMGTSFSPTRPFVQDRDAGSDGTGRGHRGRGDMES